MSNENAKPRCYDMKNNYAVGEHISHPKFGFGFVDKTIGPNKIGIYFENFEKIFLQNWVVS